MLYNAAISSLLLTRHMRHLEVLLEKLLLNNWMMVLHEAFQTTNSSKAECCCELKGYSPSQT